MSSVKRAYVTKAKDFNFETKQALAEFAKITNSSKLGKLRIVDRYDVEGLDDETFKQACELVFGDAVQEEVIDKLPKHETIIATELLPGQFDARADAASQCIQLITCSKRPIVRCARLYCFSHKLTKEQVDKIKKYLINPVEMRSASLDLPKTLAIESATVQEVPTIDGFVDMDNEKLGKLRQELGLSIDLDDIKFAQDYFRSENRNPTLTELKVLDTYWSDHCRHTTFNTTLTGFDIKNDRVAAAYEHYLKLREEVGRSDKPVSLMDIGTIGARVLKARGGLKDLDESDEINACTIKAKVDVNGAQEDWLYFFKNETHNHPTQIEPYGGAATCLGGAIRDPLSGRAYVYQSMRISGSAFPSERSSFKEEIAEKRLSQYDICTGAAAGFSSYGNQIGLATGLVDEVYDLGYEAKRMEIGAVVGAAPASNVVRKTPKAGDKIVLVGGRTGRDGIGGATGSSKAHDVTSQETCGSEVQKGNPLEERKLQRLFRNMEASHLIIRCNDFGAGGVSVAIGELADGLDINLNAVLTKYDGLDGTDLALSESQERMACVIEKENVDRFIELANQENLEAVIVAEVTDNPRMKETFNGQVCVDLSREILNSAGAPKSQNLSVPESWTGYYIEDYDDYFVEFDELPPLIVSTFNSCSKAGLTSMFDSTIGAGTVLMPLSGSEQLTPSISMVAKLPVFGETETVSGMSWGFNPDLSNESPFDGAYLAVVDSVAKLIASGFSRKDIYLTFQEYFKSLGNDPENWGYPFASVLGALEAQIDLEVAAIGGKDSMSGTYEDWSVPPTLVSFATALGKADNIISPDFKAAGNTILLIAPNYDHRMPDKEGLIKIFDTTEKLIQEKKLVSVNTSGLDIVATTIIKSQFGNWIGVELNDEIQGTQINKWFTGSFVVEVAPENVRSVEQAYGSEYVLELGKTIDEAMFRGKEDEYDYEYDLSDLLEKSQHELESIYPTFSNIQTSEIIRSEAEPKPYCGPALTMSKPKVIIPVFPGTNCEYDSARAFEVAGGDPSTFVINTLTPSAVEESVQRLSRLIDESQILMIPGGFSGGDEPGGSAKLIASYLRNPRIAESIMNLLEQRDGLILGICNGFQALLRLGLLPYGEIRDLKSDDATLAQNKIGHHQSAIVGTRISSKLSPWFSRSHLDEIYHIPISHGEGRFVCSKKMLKQLKENGQVCAQYCDRSGKLDGDSSVNPNGSIANIEAICSPDGRILGKMAHSERRGKFLYKNVPGNHNQEIFESGIDYFKI